MMSSSPARRARLRIALASPHLLGGLFALSLVSQAVAQALPEQANIVAGAASIQQEAQSMLVTQQTSKLILDWQSFRIATGRVVTFQQPDVTSVALNRVVGSASSQILGQLKSNGQVFLVNPNGIIFGQTAQVHVGGLVASTLNISNEDFQRGVFQFQGDGVGGSVTNVEPGQVWNGGTIQASTGEGAPGSAGVALLGYVVGNAGQVSADLGGSVVFGAGQRMTLDLGGPVKLKVDQGVVDAQVLNQGIVRADGGWIVMAAHGASALQAGVINQSGTVSAESLGEDQRGHVLLSAPEGAINHTGHSTVSGSAQGGGTFEAEAQRLGVSGTIAASSDNAAGGTIRLAATDTFLLDGGHIAAIGKTQGGDVTVQSGGNALLRGEITAEGQARGGRIEVAAKNVDLGDVGMSVAGDRESGSLTVAATDLTVDAEGVGMNKVSYEDVGQWLSDGFQVHLRAANDLLVDAPIFSAATRGEDGQLSLEAGRSVNVKASIALVDGSVDVTANALTPGLTGRGRGAADLRMSKGALIQTDGDVALTISAGADASLAGEMALTQVYGRTLSLDSAGFSGQFTASGKTYDGTRLYTPDPAAGATPLVIHGLVLDYSKLSLTTTYAFEDKDAGAAKAVIASTSVSGFDARLKGEGTEPRSVQLLSGGQPFTPVATAPIAPMRLAINGLSGLSRVYDGTTDAVVDVAGDQRVAGDQLDVKVTGHFDSKSIGTDKIIHLDGARLTGPDAGNYVVDMSGLQAVGTITPRPLVLSELLAQDKVYDGGTAAVVQARDNRVAGDDVQTLLTWQFDDDHAGQGKPVRLVSASLSGADAGNYLLSTAALLTAASITPRPFDVQSPALSELSGDSLLGLQLKGNGLPGDEVRVKIGNVSYQTMGGRRVAVLSGLRLEGEDAADYLLRATSLQVDLGAMTGTGDGSVTVSGAGSLPLPLNRWVLCGNPLAPDCGTGAGDGSGLSRSLGGFGAAVVARIDRGDAVTVRADGIRLPKEAGRPMVWPAR